MRILSMVVAVALATGCSGAAETNAASTSAEAPVQNSVAEPVGNAARREEPAPSAQRPGLALTANGIQVGGRTIAFEAPEGEVVAALVPVLGQPDERAANPECPAGPIRFATWRNRFTANFQEGRFAGWSLDTEGPSELRTTRGITIGSTRRELERAYRTTVEEGSLGQEFGAEDLYGVLSGPEANARVEALWGGVACIFH